MIFIIILIILVFIIPFIKITYDTFFKKCPECQKHSLELISGQVEDNIITKVYKCKHCKGIWSIKYDVNTKETIKILINHES